MNRNFRSGGPLCAFLFGSLIAVMLNILLVASSKAEALSQAAQDSMADYGSPLELQWARVQESLANEGTPHLVDELQKLRGLLEASTQTAVPAYSMAMLDSVSSRLPKFGIDDTKVVVDKALQISPKSVAVLLKANRVLREHKIDSGFQLLKRAVVLLPQDKESLAQAVNLSLYPVLLAATLSLCLVLVLSIVAEINVLFRGIVKFFPSMVGGVVAPMVGSLMVVLPVLGGPVWAMMAWALIILVFFPEKKRLVFLVGVLAVSWGSLLPLKETFSERMSQSGTGVLLRMASGVFSPTDIAELEELAGARPNDPVVVYSLGQILRREGQMSNAQSAFRHADSLWKGSEPRVKAQLGLIKFLEGDYAAADTFFTEAEKGGLDGAAFLFNQSKIRFMLGNLTQSRELFIQAQVRDRAMADTFRQREEVFGMDKEKSIIDIDLPWHRLIPTLFEATIGAQARSDERSFALMKGMSPLGLMGFGIAMILLPMVVRGNGKRRKRRSYFFPSAPRSGLLKGIMMILPGGAWILEKKPVPATVILGLVIGCVMPVCGFPHEAYVLRSILPESQLFFAGLAAIVVLLSWYGGYLVYEEE